MNLQCPHCKETLDVPMYAEHNAYAYPEPINVVTRCCGKMITMKRVVSVAVRVSDAEVDGWGNKPGDQIHDERNHERDEEDQAFFD